MLAIVGFYPEYIEAVRELAEGQRSEASLVPPGELEELLSLMRHNVPVRGDRYVKALTVVFPRGKGVREHDHPEWTCLFYAEPANTPLVAGDDVHLPQAGEMLILSPGVEHWVLPNQTDVTRVSVAMLVEDHGEN